MQLFKKVSNQKDNTQDSSKNTKFAKQPNVEILPKIGETNALSKPVTSNSVSTPQVSKGVNNAKMIAPGMFRICSDKISRLFDKGGKLVASSKSENQVDCSNGDNVCTSNAMEPKIKRFPNSTSLLGRLSRFVCGASIRVVLST
nr:hypothetical protein [Tanacetum cinerariifolium]